MRKIEKEMLQAVLTGSNWSKDNTSVSFSNNGNGLVSLHGNIIAYVDTQTNIEPDLNTLKRWPTVTTKSRLRALGLNIETKKGVNYYNGMIV